MPAQEHTCKNRKTCLRPTAVSWGPYLLPSPQPAKGKCSVNPAIPAAHLPFPAKLHPMRQVQEVSKKAERPTGCPAFCYITSFCSIYSIWNFSITIYPGYSDTRCTSPGKHVGCIAAQALVSPQALRLWFARFPLPELPARLPGLLSTKGLNSKQPESVRPACPGAAAKGNKRLGLPIQRPLGSTHALCGKAVREKKISSPC